MHLAEGDVRIVLVILGLHFQEFFSLLIAARSDWTL